MLLDAEILASKLQIFFNELIEQTLAYIIEFAKEKQQLNFFSESPLGSRVPIPYNFSETNVNGDWDFAIDREGLDAGKVIISLADYIKALFLDPDYREALLHDFLNISSGSLSVYVLIHQTPVEEEKTTLSTSFKKLDPLTQIYIVFQLRRLVDQVIKEFPLGDHTISDELVSNKTQEEWVATAAFLRKHESFRAQVYDKLEKFILQALPTLPRSLASSQKEIDKMLDLVAFYFASSPKGTIYPVVATPSMSSTSGISTPMEIQKLKNDSFALNVFRGVPIKSQLEIPYAISEKLVAEIAKYYGNIYVKYIALKKDINSLSDLKIIQQYFSLKSVHEELVGSGGNISPKKVEESFKSPELVSIDNKNRTITKSLVFEKEWGFFDSVTAVAYRDLKQEIKDELWNRVKTFDFIYDLIISEFSNELENRLTNEYDRLIQNPPWFIKAEKFDDSKFSRFEIAKLHKQLAIEVIHHAFQNGRLSVSLIEEVVRRFPAYGKNCLPFFASEMQRIVDGFRDEMGEALWKISTEGFSNINEYKAPDIVQRWAKVNLN